MRSDEATAPPQRHHDAGTAAVAAELGAHTALLERMVAHLAPTTELEDARTFAISTGAASAFVFDPAVPHVGDVEIEAWQSGNSGAVPIYVLDGKYTEAQAATLVNGATGDYVHVLLAVPNSGVARIRRPSFTGYLTVCSFAAPTAVSLVTVRVRTCEGRRR